MIMIEIVVDNTYLPQLFGLRPAKIRPLIEEVSKRLHGFCQWRVATQADLADKTVFDLLHSSWSTFSASLPNDVTEHLRSEILDMGRNVYYLSDFEATQADAAGRLAIH